MACRYQQKIFFFFVLMFLFSLNIAYAAWWELNKGLPAPADAQEVKREERLIAGNKFDFIYYASRSDIATIKNFYRSKLASSGWVEQDLVQDLKKIAGIKVSSDMEDAVNRNLSFSKDEEELLVTFLPAQYSQDNKTKFTVCHGKIGKNSAATQETSPLPALIAKPKKNIAPVYPEASLVMLSEQEKSLKASYTVKADIEDVLAFYKENMSSYGWTLIDETPINRKTTGDLAKMGIKDCPSCKNSLSAGNAEIELRFGQLDFTNQAEAKCSIMASNAKKPGQGQSELSITTIMVNYEAKK